jgi:hypothetical protein
LTSGFLHGSVSPKPLILLLGLFQIFSKIPGDIRSSRCITSVVDAGSNFAASVVDTGGKFATGVFDTGGAP